MQIFREALDECELMDLGFKGSPYTWSKHYWSGASIWERLDRAVASHNGFIKFLSSRVHHVDNSTFDHKMLWIEFLDLDFQSKKRVFWFEEVWLVDKGYGETVEGVWQASYDESENLKVIWKIENCGKELTRWSRNNFGNIRKSMKKERKELIRAERQVVQGGDSSRIVHLKKEINMLMGKEERMWKQRACITYIKEGDRNTWFFHCRATQGCRNCVTNIWNQANELCSGKDQIVATFVVLPTIIYFINPEVTLTNLDSIPQIVTGEMNDILIGEFQEWEVKVALKQMAPLKTPRPDEMHPLFYKNFWDLVRGDVINVVLHFLNSGSLPNPLNHTFITLISKQKIQRGFLSIDPLAFIIYYIKSSLKF